MSLSPGTVNSPSMSYVGQELPLFAAAKRWKRYWVEQIRPFVGQRVLEVGAGIGGTTAAILEHIEHWPQRWVCLEPDESLAQEIRQQIAAGDLPAWFEVRSGTVSELPPEPAFDTILYIDVLEHIADDAGEVARSVQRLTPGGHLIAVSPALPMLFSPFDKAVGHYRRYTLSSFDRLVDPSYERCRVSYLDTVGVLLLLGNRLLMRQGEPGVAQIRLWDRWVVPISRWVDPLHGGKLLGRSLVGVWRKPREPGD